jgi:hypothetical protein
MILEVGAGGCIMIKPPAKGSKLEKALGQVVDIGSGCSVYKSERVMNGEKVGGLTVSRMQLEESGCLLVDYSSGSPVFKAGEEEKEPDYVRWNTDVHKRDEHGQIMIDTNGNFLFLHRAGDVMLDSKGDPILASRPTNLKNSAPRIVFDGIKDGGLYPPCKLDHLEDPRYMSGKDLSALYEKVSAEVRRRVMGGQPLSYEDNPHTVASI